MYAVRINVGHAWGQAILVKLEQIHEFDGLELARQKYRVWKFDRVASEFQIRSTKAILFRPKIDRSVWTNQESSRNSEITHESSSHLQKCNETDKKSKM